MARIIKLTERDLTRIVRRVIKEQDESGEGMYVVKPGDNLTNIAKKFDMTVSDILKMNPQIKDANKIYPGDEINIPSRIVMGSTVITSTVPECKELLVYREDPKFDFERRIGDSNYMDLEITGNVELSYNATVSPNSRAVTVIKNGKPFCKIPVYSTIGDCRDEMELTSDEPGASMSASLVSPVSVNLTGSVSPKDRGIIISDGGGYFCTVPTGFGQLPESRRRRVIKEKYLGINENPIGNILNRLFGKKIKTVSVDPNGVNSYIILSSGDKITTKDNRLTLNGCASTNNQETRPEKDCVASFDFDYNQYTCGYKRGCVKD